jgi:uncharacterized protein (TIGR02246 family)
MTQVLSTEEAVRDVLRGTMAAWADNDADAFVSDYADDVTVVLSSGPYHRGKDAVREYMARGFAGPFRGTKGIDQPEDIRVLGDDAAIVVSRSGYQLPDETEVPADRFLRATWVLAKENGRWLIKSYHSSPIA